MNFDSTIVNTRATTDCELDLPDTQILESKTHIERDCELFEGGLGI
jgi:hypothetical protein